MVAEDLDVFDVGVLGYFGYAVFVGVEYMYQLGNLCVCRVVVVVGGFDEDFVVSDGFSKLVVFHDLFGVCWGFWWGEGWVEVGYASDKPVFMSEIPLFLVFFDASVLGKVNEDCWRGHVFVAWAKWAGGSLGLLVSLFGVVGGSSTAFCGDYYPSVE